MTIDVLQTLSVINARLVTGLNDRQFYDQHVPDCYASNTNKA